MKSRLFAIGGLIALLGSTATLGILTQSNAQTNPTVPAPRAGRRNRERHPEMQKALRTLERAKADLQKANRDFGGHRAKAVELTDQAIKEVQEAIKFDKN